MRHWNTVLPEEKAQRLATRITRGTDDGVVWTWDVLHRCTNARPFDAQVFMQFLRYISAPTLLLDGATSLFQIPDYDDRAACIADAARQSLEGGHLLHHDAADDLAQAIRIFLGAN
jgi:pimeloyl-ACP methyl ester carboxylesterase